MARDKHLLEKFSWCSELKTTVCVSLGKSTSQNWSFVTGAAFRKVCRVKYFHSAQIPTNTEQTFVRINVVNYSSHADLSRSDICFIETQVKLFNLVSGYAIKLEFPG